MQKYKIIHIIVLLLSLSLHGQNIDSLYNQAISPNNNQVKLEKIGHFTNLIRKFPLSESLHYYRNLIKTGKKNNDTILLAKAYLELSKKYQDNRHLEKAKMYLDSVFTIIPNQTIESKQILCNALTSKGNLLSILGFTEEGIEYFQKSLKIAQEQGFQKYILYNQNNIGSLLLDKGKAREALKYFKLNLQKANEVGNSKIKAFSYLNMSDCYKKLNKVDSSKYALDKALINATSNKYILPYIYRLYGDYYMSKKEFDKATFFINKSIEMDSTQYQSYLFMGYKNMLEKNYPKADSCYHKALKIIKRNKFIQEVPKVLDSLSNLYRVQEKHELANEYLIKSIETSDSLSQVEKEKKINTIKQKYQIEKKEKKIINQQQKIKKASKNLAFNNRLMIGAAIIFLSLFIFFVNRFQKQKTEHQIAIIDKIASERSRIARDLHDNLGAHLSFIISSIDNILFAKNIEKKILISKIKDVKEFASETTSLFRDTTWALNKDVFTVEDFINRLEIYIHRVKKSNPGMNIYLINKINTNLVINPVESLNIFRILQEAINNSVKYSQVNKTAVFFEEDDKSYIFKIIDHGVGFDQNDIKLGYGIKNMKRRIAELGGTISIYSDNGTTIIIHLPKHLAKNKKE